MDDTEKTPSSPRIELPAFHMDRTEVTNAAYAVFTGLVAVTGIAAPPYPVTNRSGYPSLS